MQDDDVLKDKKILIVDDEPDILETLEELLDMCMIDTAPNFETARKFLDKYTYDLAILDIMGVQGYDLLKITSQKDIPALMLTAHALSPENLIESLKKGAQSYVPKDKISDISIFVKDILEAHRKGKKEHGKWFARLKPFFDRKFGSGWREKDKEFWQDFDQTHAVPFTKNELEEIL